VACGTRQLAASAAPVRECPQHTQILILASIHFAPHVV